MKKNRNLELRVYELLGIKTFKKMTLRLRDMLYFPFTFKMSKIERKHISDSYSTNYNIGKAKNLDSIKKFKKHLFMNTIIHIFGLLLYFPKFLEIINGATSLSKIILTLILTCINTYCIMLQRYNCIRINKLIAKRNLLFEKQKATIKEEIRKEDSLFNDHSYKIINKNGKLSPITFEELIKSADMEMLKKYRFILSYLLNEIKFYQNNNIIKEALYYPMPTNETDILVLELRK